MYEDVDDVEKLYQLNFDENADWAVLQSTAVYAGSNLLTCKKIWTATANGMKYVVNKPGNTAHPDTILIITRFWRDYSGIA